MANCLCIYLFETFQSTHSYIDCGARQPIEPIAALSSVGTWSVVNVNSMASYVDAAQLLNDQPCTLTV